MAGTNPDQPLGNWHYEWREISNPYADFNQTKLYELIANLFSQKGHTHPTSDITGLGTWETVSTSVTGVTLYVNQALRLVSFHFYASITFNTSGYTTCGTLPSAYKPLSQVTLPFRQSEQHGYVGNDGVIYIAGTGTKNAGTSAMWCY